MKSVRIFLLICFLAVSAPPVFSADSGDGKPAAHLEFGASFYPDGFDALTRSSASSDGDAYGGSLNHFGFPRGFVVAHPPVAGPLRRLGIFARWENYLFTSPGFGREIGIEVELPRRFIAGISQHRYYNRAKDPQRIDGPGGGLWAGVFLERRFGGTEGGFLRDATAGIFVYPPHNEFDLGACHVGVGDTAGNQCKGFARYKLYGEARLRPLRRHPKLFIYGSGYVFLGNNVPQARYIWSPHPISVGGKAGFGFDIARHVALGFYRNFYAPLGRYADATLPGSYSRSGPYGGNVSEVSLTFSFDFGRGSGEN